MEVRRDSDHDVIFDDEFETAILKHGKFATGYINPVPGTPPGCEHFAETVAAYFLFDDAENSRVTYDCWASEDVKCGEPEKYKFAYDRYDFVRDAIVKY